MRLSKVQTLSLLNMISATLICSGCAGFGLKSGVKIPKQVTLELKGGARQIDENQYYSFSHITDFEDGQKVREREEAVEFRVRETVTGYNATQGTISVVAETLSKDGTVDLHDLAFPEKGEEIEYVFTKSGKVLKAKPFPPDSVFYVPPIPLPKEPVQVGDTWTLDHAWVGMKNGIPLGVHMVAILKDILPCGKGVCADVEVSGDVEVIGIKRSQADFNSKLWGRMWISVERGTVVWSEVRSKERMVVPRQRTDVVSCMISRLDEPKEWKAPERLPKICRPSDQPVEI